MSEVLERYLDEVVDKEKNDISPNNPYREIAFDEDKRRLGWFRVLSFSLIKESLESVVSIFEDRDNVIFIGMGGSINGIKPLLTLFNKENFYTLDNLDPQAISNIIDKIKDLKKTLVVSISKSGTTKETQLLSSTLKELFRSNLGEQWVNHFLWISDPASFDKLNELGWAQVRKVSIQCDGQTDIGGRFSSPHTFIFFLPLFLLLEKDFGKLQDIYDTFVSLQAQIRKKASDICDTYKDKANAYFSPITDERLGISFSSWIVQLFQESLGSKLEGLAVKTITNLKENNIFSPIELDLKIKDPVVSLISHMYFFQVFIAYYSANKGINFVTQNYVEEYKKQMRQLENKAGGQEKARSMDLDNIAKEVKKNIKPSHHFLEIVLYFYPTPETIAAIENEFKKNFPQQQILIFVGSDWNHQSYQAAFASKDTFYLLLTLASYRLQVPCLSQETLKRNIDVLKLIAKATYITLKDKASLFSLLSF